MPIRYFVIIFAAISLIAVYVKATTVIAHPYRTIDYSGPNHYDLTKPDIDDNCYCWDLD